MPGLVVSPDCRTGGQWGSVRVTVSRVRLEAQTSELESETVPAVWATVGTEGVLVTVRCGWGWGGAGALVVFFLVGCGLPRVRPSSPTRRSSDLLSMSAWVTV